MSKIIASTYQIKQQIGAGGGGIVYLAEHLRLHKQVVLKADRRTIAAKPEVLRREVDALKNLSHTYIPQVYDFLEEDGVVYTVMDYIAGESLDKLLARGVRFSQAQVIAWACELLDALCYLHSRPPHGILHGDIKPANIMLTPDGDIRLIDFNIALALGEEGAVKVGFSRGYASPEHYGMDFWTTAPEKQPEAEMEATEPLETTELLEATEPLETTELLETTEPLETTELLTTEPLSSAASSPAVQQSGSVSRGNHGVLLDVRSDIYSLGATLYHLFTGRKPDGNPAQMKTIVMPECSEAVAAIIQKAMQWNPDARFQTAQEMLEAFENLHRQDARTKRFHRLCAGTALALTVVFLLGGGTAFVGLHQMEQIQNARALAEYSQNALQKGNITEAIRLALSAFPAEQGRFDAPRTAEAQYALTQALGVYDLTDGLKIQESLELPSEPLEVVVSDSGNRMAVLYAYKVCIIDTASAKILATLPAETSALDEMVFYGDKTLFYAGENGLCAYDIDAKTTIWSGSPATAIALSADGKTIAAIYKDENQATIYNAENGAIQKVISFGNRKQSVAVHDTFANPKDNLFALNADGTRLAVSFADGGVSVYHLQDSELDIELFDTSDYTHFEGGFSGNYLAFSATKDNESLFAVIDVVNIEQIGGFDSTMPFGVYANENGIYLSNQTLLVKLDPVSGEQTEMAYTDADIKRFSVSQTGTAVTTTDGKAYFFDNHAKQIGSENAEESFDFTAFGGEYAVLASQNTPVIRIYKQENHADKQIFTYDAAYPHDEARVSTDGKTVLLFQYDRFRLYAIDGTILKEVSIPNAEEVYDQQYRREEDGCYLDVIYNDGKIDRYSAADGTLLNTSQGEKPDASLYEEFTTEHWRIAAPLHGAPEVYDLKTGKFIRNLESDAYLTYVTQVGQCLLTEYVSMDGERYGLLLNENGETIAKMPYLCDIIGQKLIFDDGAGNLRQTKLYTAEELIQQAQMQK